jgi:ABC-type Fe3+/spermidine/putrescine transport system ATPase subunit
VTKPAVELRRVTKCFGPNKAVDGISLLVEDGEFYSLLGPSGCGKTTTLRLVAGFEEPDGGEIRIKDVLVNQVRPYQRGVGMVFQSYALFPHRNVERNVAFGLEQRKTPAAEIPDRVARALEQVRLDPETFRARMPAQLSGGERQHG